MNYRSPEAGFAEFRPKCWKSALAELHISAELPHGRAIVTAKVPGWGATKLQNVFWREAESATADQHGARLPAHSESFNVSSLGELGVRQTSSASEGAPQFRQHLATTNFTLLLGMFDQPKVPAGMVQFSCSVGWPTSFWLTPDVVADWGVPVVSVSLNLGGVWIRPQFRGQGWGRALTELYWVVLREELDCLADQLKDVTPCKGRRHRCRVDFAAEYWSRTGRRMGSAAIRELKARVRAWLNLKGRRAFMDISFFVATR